MGMTAMHYIGLKGWGGRRLTIDGCPRWRWLKEWRQRQ
jgi:hypothetical protein